MKQLILWYAEWYASGIKPSRMRKEVGVQKERPLALDLSRLCRGRSPFQISFSWIFFAIFRRLGIVFCIMESSIPAHHRVTISFLFIYLATSICYTKKKKCRDLRGKLCLKPQWNHESFAKPLWAFWLYWNCQKKHQILIKRRRQSNNT